MRISDWSSDVCSSDLPLGGFAPAGSSLRSPGHAKACPPTRHPPAMDGLRPTLLFLLGERGNAASILEWQHQTDRKTRRLRRRECSPEGASGFRSEEHTSELQSLMRISYAVFCLKKKTHNKNKLIQ